MATCHLFCSRGPSHRRPPVHRQNTTLEHSPKNKSRLRRSYLEAFRICQKRVPRNGARTFFFSRASHFFVVPGAAWDAAQCVHIWRRLGFGKNVFYERGRARFFSPGPQSFFVVPGAVWDAARCAHIWRRLGFVKNGFHEMRRVRFSFPGPLTVLLFQGPYGMRPGAFTFGGV